MSTTNIEFGDGTSEEISDNETFEPMTSKPTSRKCHECKDEWSAASFWEDDEVWICDYCRAYLQANIDSKRGLVY